MAISSASKAAPKLLNLGTHGIQNLIRRHLLRPSTAAASTNLIASTSAPDSRSFNLIQLEDRSCDSSLKHLENMRNFNLSAFNFPLNLQRPFNSSVQTAAIEDDDDLDNSSDDEGLDHVLDFDDDVDDDDIVDSDDYSGSDGEEMDDD